MNNKYFLGIMVLMIAVLGILLAFSINSPINDSNALNSSLNNSLNDSALNNSSLNSINDDNNNGSDSTGDKNGSQKDVELRISAEESFPVEKIAEEIKTHPAYEGYDENTLSWLESFNGSVMFTSKNFFVVMNEMDASKLPTSVVNDAFIYDDFRCDIIENRSLGNGLKDILYVENVEFENQDIIPMEI